MHIYTFNMKPFLTSSTCYYFPVETFRHTAVTVSQNFDLQNATLSFAKGKRNSSCFSKQLKR